MDSETAEALEQSIEHWKQNAAAENYRDVMVGAGACALCCKFRFNAQARCEGCPVSGRTGKTVCYGSPYDAAVDAFADWGENLDGVKERVEFHIAALAEVAFLESLRDPK